MFGLYRGEVLTKRELEAVVSWRTTPALWKKLKPLAREMRNKPTEAENVCGNSFVINKYRLYI